MAKQMVTAKVFRVGCAPSIEEIDASLEGLQTIVGGYIEGIHLGPDHILYCNEDGRAKGLLPNLQLPNGVVVLGDAVMVLHNSDSEAISLTEHEPEAIRKVIRHLAEDGSRMSAHTPTPWVVVYHSHGDIFEVKVVEDKMVADGLAEDADNKTAGNVETLSLPASKLFEACNAHDVLLKAATRLAREVPCYCDGDRTKPDFKPCGCCDLAKIITTMKGKKERRWGLYKKCTAPGGSGGGSA